jgi:hypothetical protein
MIEVNFGKEACVFAPKTGSSITEVSAAFTLHYKTWIIKEHTNIGMKLNMPNVSGTEDYKKNRLEQISGKQMQSTH